MKNFENHLPYSLLALLALAVFYGIYFAKMLAQRRRGIQTRQIGRRKERSIHTVEVLMGIATLCAPAAQLLSVGFGWSCLSSGARFTGFFVAMIGDAVFLLSVLCMKGGHTGKRQDRAGNERYIQVQQKSGFSGI